MEALPLHPAASAPATAARRPEFLSGPMSSLVDLIRVVACVAVVIAHSGQLGFHQGAPYVTPLGSHYAVMVFFVVSGLAVASGANRPGATLADYVVARVTRILPVAVLAMGFGLTLYALRGPAPFHPPGQETLTWQSVAHPLLFVTEAPWGQSPVWNLPWWSLSYEVWYYALFGAAMFLSGMRRAIWLIVLALLAGPLILLLAPAWLMGAALALRPEFMRIGRRGGAALLVAALAVFLVARAIDTPILGWVERQTNQLVNSRNVVGDLMISLATAMALAGARPLLPLLARPIAAIAPALRWAAGMTFTAYLMHDPQLCLLLSWGLAAPPGPIGMVAPVLGVLAVCALLAQVCERRSPALRRAVHAWLDRRGRTALASPLPA